MPSPLYGAGLLQKWPSPFYDDVLEVKIIAEIEEKLLADAQEYFAQVQANSNFNTMTIDRVKEWEDLLSIIADPETEDLDFRILRIKNRFSFTPPYTYRYLESKLTELVGAGNFNMEMDYNARAITVTYTTDSINMYQEVRIVINQLAPANLIYRTGVYNSAAITVSATSSIFPGYWNYHLGSWKLGAQPFMDLGYTWNYKFDDWNLDEKPFATPPANERKRMEVTQLYLNTISAESMGSIVSARINGISVIPSISKNRNQNVFTVSYSIPPNTVTTVTKLELLDASGEVLAEMVVAVPNNELLLVTQEFLVKKEAIA